MWREGAPAALRRLCCLEDPRAEDPAARDGDSEDTALVGASLCGAQAERPQAATLCPIGYPRRLGCSAGAMRGLSAEVCQRPRRANLASRSFRGNELPQHCVSAAATAVWKQQPSCRAVAPQAKSEAHGNEAF